MTIPSLERLAKPARLVGKGQGPKRLLAGEFSAPAVLGAEKENIETIGSWPLGRTESTDPSELR